MAGNSNSIEQVRERIDIVDVIGQHVALRKTGRSFKGLCPFHQEKTPSFIVFPESQSFHCFGCGAGGDVFNFVMQMERVDFREALEQLAKQAGVELESLAPPPPPEQIERHARLHELNRRAALFYSHVLWNTSVGADARELLERRGVDRSTAERFQLGFAPDRWDALLAQLTKRGAELQDILAAGLATARDDGGAYDRFRNRLIFPIRDREGNVVGFGGRALGDAQPKYLNTPQTPIFDKSSLLYAFDLAADAIKKAREVVVVEGYMDAIAAHQFGFENVVASMGTALTEQQIALVRRSVDRIVLALDADAAGQAATVRGLDVLRESLGEAGRALGMEKSPDLRSLVRFERVLKTDIRIVRLPAGKDPDELIRKDVDAWRRALGSTVRLIEFYVDAIIGEQPPDDPHEKSRLAGRLVPVLHEIDDAVVREHYIVQVSRRLGVAESLLRQKQVRVEPRRRSRTPDADATSEPVSIAGRRVAKPEQYLTGLVLAYPLILASLLSEITDQDLQDARNRSIIQAIRLRAPETAEDAFAAVPEELHAHAFELLGIVDERPTQFPRHVEREARETLQRMRKERHDFQFRELQTILNQAQDEGNLEEMRSTLALLDQLRSRFLEFSPEKSPYFRDVRDNVS